MYGENSGVLRAELAKLLRQHRIQQRIGGAGIHTVPVTTTTAERKEIGQLIGRYRYGVLTWCRQALTTASPSVHLDRQGHATAPDAELRRRLQAALTSCTASLPTIADLTTAHEFPLVDAWRHAARAAALGEHDFAGDMEPGRLDINKCLTIVKDTAEIIRGLIVLDRRYGNIPGWEPLHNPIRLGRAAEAFAFVTADDYTVDRRGWHPPATVIDGPARAGIAGVIQAEHNLLMHLNRFPNALNFKRLLDSQRELSTLLAARVADAHPELSTAWRRRAATYQALHLEARNIAGNVGSGSRAVAEAANAISRLRRLPGDTSLSNRALGDVSGLFTAVDRRLADIFEHGARERLYFASTTLPRIVDNDGQLTHAVRTRYLPITSLVQTDLIRLVHEELRPPDEVVEPPPGAGASRRDLSESIRHRPQPHTRGLGL